MHQGQIVAQYCERIGMTQEQLAEEMCIHLRTVQKLESRPMIRSIARRWFLVGLLGIPASQLDLQGEPPWSRKRELPPHDDTMGFFEHELALRWKVYKTSGPGSASHGLDLWIAQVESFAQTCQGTPWLKRALNVLSMSYQLKGSILRDTLLYPQAQQALQKALQIAKEINNHELVGAALLREGTVYIRQEEPLQAISHFDAALQRIENRSFPSLRGNILQARAEAYAMANRSQECWRSIGLAEHIFGREEQSKEQSHATFNAPKATAWKGVYALLLHDYERAITLLDKGLATYNPTSLPSRTRFLSRKAEAHYGARQIGECIEVAQEALTFANSLGNIDTVDRVSKLHATLAQSRWSKEPGMKTLGATLGKLTN